MTQFKCLLCGWAPEEPYWEGMVLVTEQRQLEQHAQEHADKAGLIPIPPDPEAPARKPILAPWQRAELEAQAFERRRRLNPPPPPPPVVRKKRKKFRCTLCKVTFTGVGAEKVFHKHTEDHALEQIGPIPEGVTVRRARGGVTITGTVSVDAQTTSPRDRVQRFMSDRYESACLSDAERFQLKYGARAAAGEFNGGIPVQGDDEPWPEDQLERPAPALPPVAPKLPPKK